jgi:hypothetical protein
METLTSRQMCLTIAELLLTTLHSRSMCRGSHHDHQLGAALEDFTGEIP